MAVRPIRGRHAAAAAAAPDHRLAADVASFRKTRCHCSRHKPAALFHNAIRRVGGRRPRRKIRYRVYYVRRVVKKKNKQKTISRRPRRACVRSSLNPNGRRNIVFCRVGNTNGFRTGWRAYTTWY